MCCILSDLDDLVTVAPIFLLMGVVLITGYLAPYVMGKFDDWDQNAQVKKNNLSAKSQDL